MAAVEPLVTIAVPSYQQGRYLDEALSSIFRLDIQLEVIVADAGSPGPVSTKTRHYMMLLPRNSVGELNASTRISTDWNRFSQ